MTYNVSSGMSNHTQSINRLQDLYVLQISSDSKKRRASASMDLRSQLTAGKPLDALRSFYAYLPPDSQHANHYVVPVSKMVFHPR